jgi:hypothetical protein
LAIILKKFHRQKDNVVKQDDGLTAAVPNGGGGVPAAPASGSSAGPTFSTQIADEFTIQVSKWVILPRIHKFFKSNISEVVESFDSMSLKEELLRGIYAFGFEKPSAIQQRAIVPCCEGKDVIAQAQSGTGKTATFSISVLQRVDEKDPNVQALVMAPTRELAQQV